MYPIDGVGVTTPYGKRGSHWSCNENSNGHGVHTGADFACPQGTPIRAPIDGQIRHRSYGSSFGCHQFAISPDPGQPFAAGEVFFAHTTDRPKDGTYVQAGAVIAHVGSEGNATGPHLHLEYHPNSKGAWSCAVHANPQPVLDHEGDDMPLNQADLDKIRSIVSQEVREVVGDVVPWPTATDPNNTIMVKSALGQVHPDILRALVSEEVREMVGDVVKWPTADNPDNTIFAKTALAQIQDLEALCNAILARLP